MTISRVNASGWSILDKYMSAQANGMDINGAAALDKRAGQTDTLSSVVTGSGAGRLIASYVTGADADTTYAIATGIQTIMNGSLTANRTYRLSATGAVVNDFVTIPAHGTYSVTVLDDTSSANLGIVGPSGSSADWGEYRFNGTAWTLFASGKKPNLTSNRQALAIARLYVMR